MYTTFFLCGCQFQLLVPICFFRLNANIDIRLHKEIQGLLQNLDVESKEQMLPPQP